MDARASLDVRVALTGWSRRAAFDELSRPLAARAGVGPSVDAIPALRRAAGISTIASASTRIGNRLFGRLRSAMQAASATAEAYEARSTMPSASREAGVTTSSWVQRRTGRAERTLVSQQETLRLRGCGGIGHRRRTGCGHARPGGAIEGKPPIQAAQRAGTDTQASLCGGTLASI
jgi:hypothetical protein